MVILLGVEQGGEGEVEGCQVRRAGAALEARTTSLGSSNRPAGEYSTSRVRPCPPSRVAGVPGYGAAHQLDGLAHAGDVEYMRGRCVVEADHGQVGPDAKPAHLGSLDGTDR
jgi:hypothetical protein